MVSDRGRSSPSGQSSFSSFILASILWSHLKVSPCESSRNSLFSRPNFSQA